MRVAKIFKHSGGRGGGGGGGGLENLGKRFKKFEILNYMQTLLDLSLKNSE